LEGAGLDLYPPSPPNTHGGGRVRVGGLELGLGGGPTSILGFEMERERRTFK